MPPHAPQPAVPHLVPFAHDAQTEPPFPARFPTLAEVPEQLALPEGQWTVVTQETVRSPHTSPDGVHGHRDNHVWHFRRH